MKNSYLKAGRFIISAPAFVLLFYINSFNRKYIAVTAPNIIKTGGSKSSKIAIVIASISFESKSFFFGKLIV